MRARSLSFMMLMSTALTGCVAFKPPQISYDDEQPAVLQADPPKPVQVVELPKPLPLPGQLKPLPGARSSPEPRDPRQRVDLANAAPGSSRAAAATSTPCRCFRLPTAPSTRSMPHRGR